MRLDLESEVDRPAKWGHQSRLERRADAQIRTGDPFITSEVLYQLSYVGEASTLAALRRIERRP